ncbi:unknown protein [Oryza sativa Japonica Group]|uniref:Os01g0393000 protein n=2 Tax=Oryza sativa subsp. japonica TaxID=39947 RepID=A0A0P0V2X2_ORYSJ|nr:hypothetical protein EE612_002836 [Oryza sativa]KAF2950308.1 hypothetical protein DAI22_01g187500 [Oryza sativa Japonica Group]BAD68973.1 unknown protein [Oryza sativa Japonica Group]BAG93168.1 unnamed protein product [Oryza sativa Japonica Group]BAH91096.1 Os01g0393000 [Oryza sativa Japonica Group]|eukprot:NP_001172366.1 Os01g0393000 [Oryza sativa Japonica Group]
MIEDHGCSHAARQHHLKGRHQELAHHVKNKNLLLGVMIVILRLTVLICKKCFSITMKTLCTEELYKGELHDVFLSLQEAAQPLAMKMKALLARMLYSMLSQEMMSQ